MTGIANFPDIRPSLLLDFANSGCVDPRIQCTRASSATCFGPDGKLRTVAANVPRIDYDPVTGKCLGLLVEEARTNLWLNSATAVTQSFAVTAQAYTLSFEGGGAIALTGAYLGDSSAGTLQAGRRTMTFTPSVGSLSCTPTGDVRNVQIEAGAFPTSYIPTEASAVTRALDALSLSNTDSEGVFQGEFTLVQNLTTSAGIPNLIDSELRHLGVSVRASANNRIRLYANTINGGRVAVSGRLNGDTTTFASSLVTSLNKAIPEICAAFSVSKLGPAKGCMNGGDVVSAAQSGLVLGEATLYFGTMDGVGSPTDLPTNGHMQRVVVYPKVLDDAILKRLTA